MAAELFFEGTTQGDRVLKLYYEHVAFDTFEDEDGVTVNNPTETAHTGTLDGAPIVIEALNIRMGESVTVRSDQGTFTAIATDYQEDHPEALKRYREARPSKGWDVTLEASEFVDERWRFTLKVTNDRVVERVEVRMSDETARSWSPDGTSPPPAAIIEEDTFIRFRSSAWDKVQNAAEQPTEIIWGRLQR